VWPERAVKRLPLVVVISGSGAVRLLASDLNDTGVWLMPPSAELPRTNLLIVSAETPDEYAASAEIAIIAAIANNMVRFAEREVEVLRFSVFIWSILILVYVFLHEDRNS
jgi:hypothetical protein